MSSYRNPPLPSPARLANSRAVAAAPAETDRALLHRFVAHKEQSAFESLLRRHGPMVWGVCRRLLRDAHEAEDAFQATFLVFVRKSKTIHQPDLLSNWLYGVAYRTAMKARMKAQQRSERGGQAGAQAAREGDPEADAARRELYALLDQELNGLPRKYRAPLVLCYLEGRSHAQAAHALGWPVGSMSRRLAKARETLRARLRRRGLALSAGLLALWLSRSSSADVPANLVHSTCQSAAMIATGKAACSDVAATSVVLLVEEVLAGLLAGRLRWLAVSVLPLLLAAFLTSAFLDNSSSRASTAQVRVKLKTPLPVATQKAPANGFVLGACK